MSAQDSTELRESEAELREELQGAQEAAEAVSTELDAATQVREQVQARLDAAVRHAEELNAQLTAVREQQRALEAEIAGLIAQANAAAESLGAQVRALYVNGAGESFAGLFDIAGASDIAVRTHYLAALSHAEQADIERYGSLETRLERRRADLALVDQELAELSAQAELARQAVDREFLTAAGVEQQLVDQLATAEANAAHLAALAEEAQRAAEQAEAAERAAAEAAARAAAEAAALAAAQAEAARRSASVSGGGGPAPVNTTGMACPQDHPRSYSDTWGAPRSGGRSHKGTDIFGARGGLVFAITSGVVERTRVGSLPGLFLSLRGDDGNTYWYMHMQDFVASAGQRVSAGQVIAHNGDTGNARGTSPHVHFEYHPGGGGPVNPYPLVRSVCG